MAHLFKQDPAFFRKKDTESWSQAVERISSQLPGLSMKTGSFGTVWQDPAHAAISAIDRHMARELDKQGGIFASAAERTDWENRAVKLWNDREGKRIVAEEAKNAKAGVIKDIRPPDVAADFDDLQTKGGADGFMGEMLLSHVGKALTPKFRMAKGEINPNLPQHLRDADWISEPEKVFQVGRAYRQALDVNQRLADENGLNLFMSQWMEWDRIRNRFEPHENMFPGRLMLRQCRPGRCVRSTLPTRKPDTRPMVRTTKVRLSRRDPSRARRRAWAIWVLVEHSAGLDYYPGQETKHRQMKYARRRPFHSNSFSSQA